MQTAICNELYAGWDLATAFRHIADTGYDGVEIAPFTLAADVLQVGPSRRRQVREIAAENGLQVIGLHWLLAQTTGLHLTNPEKSVRRRTTKYLMQLTDLCADIGGKIMVFGSPQQRNLIDGVSPQQGFDYAVEVFRDIAPRLVERNVVLALEPLGPDEGNFMLTAQAAIELTQAVDSTNVRLHLDVKAMATEPTPIPDIIRNSGKWLHHFHANDPNRQGPGMGNVDFQPIIAALRDVNYGGFLSVEVFDYQPGIEALSVGSLKYLQEMLA